MRILTVSHFFDSHGGGLERVAGHLVRQFSAMGHESIWAASAETPPAADIANASVIQQVVLDRKVIMTALNVASTFLYPNWRRQRPGRAAFCHDRNVKFAVAFFDHTNANPAINALFPLHTDVRIFGFVKAGMFMLLCSLNGR